MVPLPRLLGGWETSLPSNLMTPLWAREGRWQGNLDRNPQNRNKMGTKAQRQHISPQTNAAFEARMAWKGQTGPKCRTNVTNRPKGPNDLHRPMGWHNKSAPNWAKCPERPDWHTKSTTSPNGPNAPKGANHKPMRKAPQLG